MNICSFSSSPFLISHAVPFQRQRNARPRPVAVSKRSTEECGYSDEYGTNFYKILSLRLETASFGEIKKAYRGLALRYHPDVCEPSRKEESTRMFILLHMAYKTLSDPVLRDEYDGKLSSESFGGRGIRAEDGRTARKRWQEQIQKLRMRSNCGTGTWQGSWGSRMRAQNMHKEWINEIRSPHLASRT